MHQSAAPIRILIADDQRIYRQALSRLIDSQPDFTVVGEAGTSAEIIGLCRQLKPDMLLLDFGLPASSGIQTLRELGPLAERVCVILITDRVDHADVATALQLGARGVITKDEDCEILFRSIRKVKAGEYWISRASVRDLVSAVRSAMVHAKTRTQKFKITPRQHEIISKVVSGHSNREIAQQFSLSEDTVKRHLTNIFDKLGVSNRLELAVFALHHELHDAS